MIELPVCNRNHTIRNIVLWSLALLFILFIGLSISSNITIIILAIIIALFFTFNMIKYYKKRNVKSVVLEIENIVVYLGKEKIKIPYENVYRVIGGIGGIGYKGEMIKSYNIYLKAEYVFGNKICARYDVFDISREDLENDFYEIEILKERVGIK